MKQRWLTLCISFAVCGTLLWLFIWSGQHVSVPLSALLASNPVFPTRWQTGDIPVASIEWRVWQDYNALQPEFYAETEVGRVWRQKDGKPRTPSITQRVLQYNNPGRATLQYYLSRPERAYYDKWPHFTVPDSRDWNYSSATADRQHVVCGMGIPSNCQVWYYWAQYGQYIVEVSFFAPNQGIDTQLFAQIVQQIDSHIEQQLKAGSAR